MVTTILYTTFISLVGLQLCVPNNEFEELTNKLPITWCTNPLFRIIYGISQLLGVLFVLGMAIYLTFKAHWWYIILYIGLGILGKIIAYVIQIPLLMIFTTQIQRTMFKGLAVKRFVGTTLIIGGFILYLCLVEK